jgi:hypothetical protein
LDDDTATDKLIRNEVAHFLETEQMTEQNLIKLDMKLSYILSNGNKPGSQYGDIKSNIGRGSMIEANRKNDLASSMQQNYQTADSRG